MSQTVPLDLFVRSAVARACERAGGDIDQDASLLDLRIDSLRMVAIVAQVEQEYGTRFTADVMMELFLAEYVGDLVGIMRDHM